MSTAFSILIISLLAATSFASDAVELDTSNCAIKGAEGIYSYDPTTGRGPSEWGSLLPEFSACGEGESQSPIDFPIDVVYKPRAMGPMPSLRNSNWTLLSSTENWALTCKEENSCGFTMFNDVKYYHFNTHFHSPSEHRLRGKQYPLEAHFVHASEDGRLAVISTMFDYSDDNSYPATIFEGAHRDYKVNRYFEGVMEGVMENKEEIEAKSRMVVKPNLGYCTLTGSLTTPPCSEGVSWILSMNVETISRRQVHAYKVSAGASFDGNNRPVQPLNDRVVTCYI